ncbi:MAG: FHA domain-containing protein [Lachnospiraceae bacterium]|nr:FHA domain-containing protein [Lachnospiraceae bacterium]
MAVGYKNLIMIDNSKSVGKANFSLCKETAKYICRNSNPKDSFSIAIFGEKFDSLTEYVQDKELLISTVDGIETADRDTFITDNLVEIINEWDESDVACRNIILFTDGEESESVLHANEELYYLLQKSGYPVYVIQSVEKKDIPPAKNLSAIATLSNGKLLLTEFEGSEAGSEITLGNNILEAIEERREKDENLKENESRETTDNMAVQEDISEEDGEETSQEVKKETAGEAALETQTLYIENENDRALAVNDNEASALLTAENKPIIRNKEGEGGGINLSLIFPVLGLVIAVVFAYVIHRFTKTDNKKEKRERRFIADMVEETGHEAKVAENAEEYDLLTCKMEEDFGATLILEPKDGAKDIVLEDCSDPTRLYRAVCEDCLIVGRMENVCDIVIDRDDSISARHCELSVKGDNWYVRDLHSSNGTKVNAKKVFQELLLKNGDILQLGKSALQVRI